MIDLDSSPKFNGTQVSEPTGDSQFKSELSTEYYHLLEITNEFDTLPSRTGVGRDPAGE
jgi:hypothetical protein